MFFEKFLVELRTKLVTEFAKTVINIYYTTRCLLVQKLIKSATASTTEVITKFAKTIVCVIQVQFFARLSKKTYLLNGNIYLR